MRYRSEIDGLRALAVVPVILFHAGFSTFGGGYVGVDVFFVISGYLISTILIAELSEGRFSLLRFYERRARRILPALVVVMLLCLPFAWAWLLPRDLKDFSQSLFAASIFSSNILFWIEAGYFDTSAELKPLLHTWSLAVEEQFYILFPLLLMAGWSWGRGRLLVLLGSIFIASLVLAHVLVSSAPSAAFYLLPTRAWELMAGAFCAFYLYKRSGPTAGAVIQAGSFLGVSLILFSILAFDHETAFPGLPALVPVGGTVLIILCAVPGTWVQRLLSQPMMVGVGLISYSAYLGHQPLFAFARYRSLTEPSESMMLGLCVLVLPLAWLSWKYVEAPFRHSRRISRQWIFGASAAAGVALMALGGAGQLTDGFRQQILTYRVSPELAAVQAQIIAATQQTLEQQMVDDNACRFWAPMVDDGFLERFRTCAARHGPGVVVLGDSHAMNLYNAITYSDVLPFVVGLARGGCRPHDPKAECHYAGFDAFARMRQGEIAAVIYHQSGSYFLADEEGAVDSQKVFEQDAVTFHTQNIDKTAIYLTQLSTQIDVDVLWLGPFLEYRHDPAKAVFSPKFLQVNPKSVTVFDQLEQVLQKRHTGQRGFDYVPFDQVYEIPQDALIGECFQFRDIDHFSRCGEQAIGASEKMRVFLTDMRNDL